MHSTCVCVCVYVCTCIFTYTAYVCVCIQICIHIYSVCVFVCAYRYMYTHVHMHSAVYAQYTREKQDTSCCVIIYTDIHIHTLYIYIEYTEDYDKIKSWVSLLCSGRKKDSGEVIACSRHPDGTEVNYGLLTRNLVQSLIELGGDVQLLSTVTALQQQPDKSWLVAVKKNDLTAANQTVKARFVFAASGGGSLRILQMAGIPEVAGYGGMPVSGKFLVCQKPEIIEQNRNKVYGRAAIGAPPMSVPHLDWRTIYGKDCIFFGPFAGFSPAVFKMSGSPLDWLSTFNLTNILPMAAMGLQNMDLVKYLVGEVFSSRDAQLEALRKFVPDAKPEDWTMVWAGQRIQIVKPDPKIIGKLEFGTEVLASADGTIVGLLGASPGASVSPHIAIEVMSPPLSKYPRLRLTCWLAYYHG